MHSELFSLFGFQLQSYGLCLALGFILCYLFARKLAIRTGRNPNEVDTLITVAAVCGILGARSVYVWQNWSTEFAADPLTLFMVWRGGLVFYGGFILASLGIAAYAVMKRESILSLGDFCVIFVPLGHAFGRIGCFFHGCCYGALCGDSPVGVCFPPSSPAFMQQLSMGLIHRSAATALPVYPTQLFEAIGCALLFFLLWTLYRLKRTARGLCIAVYCCGYALLRFVGEIFRDDPRGERYFNLSFSQGISILLILFGTLVALHLLWEKTNGTVRR
ncbi:MAG: prolipoprotein diacylglyceryl transferase [Kiritimatiellia bacterium]